MDDSTTDFAPPLDEVFAVSSSDEAIEAASGGVGLGDETARCWCFSKDSPTGCKNTPMTAEQLAEARARVAARERAEHQ